jgi:Eukaryotic aspartyl protease
MSKLLFVITTIALIGAFATPHPHRVPLKRSPTPSKMIGPFGFLQESLSIGRADLSYPYFAEADIGDFRGQLVAISLFNSHVFLSNCYPIYKYFNCTASQDTCIPFVKMRDHADFPYYIIEGYRLLVNMTLGNFGRGQQVKALYGDICTNNCYDNDQIVGSVGLSLNDSNIRYFDTEYNKFSVWLERDGSDGELIFGEDSSHESEETFIMINNLTKNWEIPLLMISLLDNVYSFTGQAILDVNSNFIGIPENVHWQIKKDLKYKFNFVCIREMMIPNCTFFGDINTLPPLIFTHAGGNTLISLPSSVYTRKLGDQLYSLLLVSLNENSVQTHQYPVTPAYNNYVVFGAPFLQYYYTIFNYNNTDDPQIKLFVPKQSGFYGLSAWAVIGIILGVLLLIGIIVGSVMAFKKNREKKRQDSLVNPESRVGYISYNQ